MLVGCKAYKCLSLPSEDSSLGEGFTWAGINLLDVVLSRAQLLLEKVLQSQLKCVGVFLLV